jgi:Immunity protein 26
VTRVKKLPEGTFLRIPLSDGSYAYGRVLDYAVVAFYNHRTTEPASDLDEIASMSVLFRLSVRLPIPDEWKVLGRRDLEGEVAKPVVEFRQDVADFTKSIIFDSAGMKRQAEPEECVGIERAAVWDAHHVEERLLDKFMGRPNATEERLRVRFSDDD